MATRNKYYRIAKDNSSYYQIIAKENDQSWTDNNVKRSHPFIDTSCTASFTFASQEIVVSWKDVEKVRSCQLCHMSNGPYRRPITLGLQREIIKMPLVSRRPMMLDDVSISPQISEQYISSPPTTLTSLSRSLPLDEVNPFFWPSTILCSFFSFSVQRSRSDGLKIRSRAGTKIIASWFFLLLRLLASLRPLFSSVAHTPSSSI